MYDRLSLFLVSSQKSVADTMPGYHGLTHRNSFTVLVLLYCMTQLQDSDSHIINPYKTKYMNIGRPSTIKLLVLLGWLATNFLVHSPIAALTLH